DLETQGKGYILASVGKAGGEVPYTAYFAAQDCDKDTLQKFTNAIYEGQRFVKSHSAAEIAKAIQPSFAETDIEIIEKVVQRYKDIGAYSDTPAMTKQAFDRIIEIIKNAQEIDEDAVVEFEKVIDNQYAQKVK
ncbi:MAG: ABC transporter substrate-binding protein, partial [Oscillospiraceae bacterium]